MTQPANLGLPTATTPVAISVTSPVTTNAHPSASPQAPADPPTANTSGKGRYRAILITGAVFILLQVTAMILTFYSSALFSADAVKINMAGRQRMLSQRTAKLLYQLEAANLNPAEEQAVRDELKLTHNVFDETLTAFREGGQTLGGDFKTPVTLRQVSTADTQKSVSDADTLWADYGTAVADILAGGAGTDPAVLAPAVAMAKERNLQLLALMNTLTGELQTASENRGSTLRVVQTVLLVLVILNFLYLAINTVGRLQRRDEDLDKFSKSLSSNNDELESTNSELAVMQDNLSQSHNELQTAYESVSEFSQDAERRAKELTELSADLTRMQEESDTIFSSVGHGLCLIDEEWKIGKQVSSAMYSIFETDTLASRSFLDLMRPLVTEKDARTLKSFLELLFNPKTSSKQLAKFNPLKSIEITLSWDGKSFVNKHLGFEFQRIMVLP